MPFGLALWAIASIDGARQAKVTAEARVSAVHKTRKDGKERRMNKPTSESGEWLQPFGCNIEVSIVLGYCSEFKLCSEVGIGWGAIA